MPTTTLPVEIWREILRQATFIPGILETKWDHSPENLLWRSLQTRDFELAKVSLPTKRAIVRVSRSWRDIGVEFLYEHVSLPFPYDSRTISRIASILEHSHLGPNQAGYGWWTKRVDLPGTTLCSSHTPTVLRLLESCRNLQALIIQGDGAADIDSVESLCSLLQSSFTHSLKRLGFSELIVLDRPGNQQPLQLPNVPLDTLQLMYRGSFVQFSVDHAPSLANVSTLYLDIRYFGSELHSIRFPALQHLFLSFTEIDIPPLIPFMTLHGPLLASLHLRTVGGHDRLSDVLTLTPRLWSLVIGFSNIKWLGPNWILANVTHIGIESINNPEFAGCAPVDLIPLLHQKVFPSLRCIRMMNELSPVQVDEYQNSGWVTFMEVCTAIGIHLRDGNGKSFTITYISRGLPIDYFPKQNGLFF